MNSLSTRLCWLHLMKRLWGFSFLLLRPVCFCFDYCCVHFVIDLNIKIYPSTAYCSPFCLDLEDIVEVLLQKSSLTLTAIALVHVLAMAFGLTVPGIVSDIATVTKGAGPWRSVNCLA